MSKTIYQLLKECPNAKDRIKSIPIEIKHQLPFDTTSLYITYKESVGAFTIGNTIGISENKTFINASPYHNRGDIANFSTMLPEGCNLKKLNQRLILQTKDGMVEVLENNSVTISNDGHYIKGGVQYRSPSRMTKEQKTHRRNLKKMLREKGDEIITLMQMEWLLTPPLPDKENHWWTPSASSINTLPPIKTWFDKIEDIITSEFVRTTLRNPLDMNNRGFASKIHFSKAPNIEDLIKIIFKVYDKDTKHKQGALYKGAIENVISQT